MPDKESKAKKASENKTSVSRKKSSMRESAAKSRASAEKPKKVRKAASAATKPVGKAGKALNTEFHIIGKKDSNFFTRSRRITPKYFREAWKELKNVTWPGRMETWRLVFAVFVFSLTLGLFIAVLDYGLERLLREVVL
jgi:preprotein translocase SecE subunit